MNSVRIPRASSFDDYPELYDQMAPRLLRLAFTYRIQKVDAEDLVQQTFLTFLTKGHDVACAEGWLVTVMKRQCLRHLRTQRRRLYDALDTTILETINAPASDDVEKKHLLRELRDAIAEVPGKCQWLLQMRYRLGFNSAETASSLGYRESGFRKVASRCLAALSQKLLSPAKARRNRVACKALDA